jgi:two-component system alkaline phosphatase synthesis response regulator PhoP
MKGKLRLLVVEDEPAIRAGLVDVFVYHGFDVESAATGSEGLQKSLSGTFDLILLDVMLPGIDGFDICNRIRAQDRDQPIIMLTARSSDEEIIRGLSLGADDYVAKPFSVAQLVLRVQAVLRRVRPLADAAERIRIGGHLEIDAPNLAGTLNGEPVAFTRREIEILRYLRDHAGRPVPREELLNKVWGYARTAELETRTVDIHIAKLRRKIEPDPARPAYLLTVRGAGYRLAVE